jgi:NADPH-dependent ferric siderophore reductase
MTADPATALPTSRDRLLRKFGRSWSLRVDQMAQSTPRMRAITLRIRAPGFTYLPGQNLVLLMPGGDGQFYARHYTVAASEPDGRIRIDFMLHGDGPGANWARSATPGDVIEGFGPRGRVVPSQAPWQYFACDETGIPAVAALLAVLPAVTCGIARIDIHSDADKQMLAHPPAIDLRWQVRSATGLAPTLHPPTRRPDGDCHITLVGETQTVRAQRTAALERGFLPTEIVGEGYWRAGRFGGHDHLVP